MPPYLTRLSSLPRRGKVALQAVVDASLVFGSFAVAMLLRLEEMSALAGRGIWAAAFFATLVAILAFYRLGLYRVLVRYISGRFLMTVGQGAVLSAIALYVCRFGFGVPIPRSVPIMHAVLVFLSVGGARFVARQIFRQPKLSSKVPVIIYGAGEAGLQLSNSLFHGREYAPVALVDDSKNLQGLMVGGLRVYDPDELASLIDHTGAREILLAIPSIGRAGRREIIHRLEGLPLEIKTIPGIAEIISGQAQISELRTVSPEDLLGRDPVAPDSDLLRHDIAGKIVMVSGAGGSIGSELCRQILSQCPKALILYEMSEYALYSIEVELNEIAKRIGADTQIVPLLGSVQHSRRLEAAIRGFAVQTIYHAAAYKHVPLVEENVVEGVRNNVFGTLEIAQAAANYGVERFILISTDKAVRPTNVMGATKRVAELICQAQAKSCPTTVFSMVRFGNVLGSSGSVIPRFKAQIEQGGPITVTHQDINRYFMTIPEASQLVIQAGAMAKGGDVFVLDMGEPVKILDLAQTMVKLHGMTPYVVDCEKDISADKGDIPIRITGLRKGEKLYEELLIGNDPTPTRHPRIMTASEVSLPIEELSTELEKLFRACEQFDLPGIISILQSLPLSYAPRSEEIADYLWNTDLDGRAKHAAGDGGVTAA